MCHHRLRCTGGSFSFQPLPGLFKTHIELPEAAIVVLLEEAFAWLEAKGLQTYLTGLALTVVMVGTPGFAMNLEGVLNVIRPIQGELEGLM